MMPGGCCGTKKQKLTTSSNNLGGECPNNSKSSNGVCLNGSSSGSAKGCSNMQNGYCNGALTNFSPVNGVRLGLLGQKPLRYATVDMVVYCFDVLHSYLHNYDPPKIPPFPNDQFPLFVTWKMGKEKKLRGCIGTFTSTSLHQGLREYAITSACKDSRFDPVTAEDFSRLHCSISLLLDFEVADHYLDWQIGVHGIRIEFNNEKGSKKAATYLPEVSTEQGWNHIQTIDSLLRKGGYKGTITSETRTSVCLVRFQSEKIGISYTEYVSFKNGGGTLNGLYAAVASAEPCASQSQQLSSPPIVRNGFHLNAPSGTASTTFGLRRQRANAGWQPGGSPPPMQSSSGAGAFRQQTSATTQRAGSCANLPGVGGRLSPRPANSRYAPQSFNQAYRPPV